MKIPEAAAAAAAATRDLYSLPCTLFFHPSRPPSRAFTHFSASLPTRVQNLVEFPTGPAARVWMRPCRLPFRLKLVRCPTGLGARLSISIVVLYGKVAGLWLRLSTKFLIWSGAGPKAPAVRRFCHLVPPLSLSLNCF